MREYYLIVGCARSGIGSARFLLKKGYKVILLDSKDYDVIFNIYPEISVLQEDPNVILVFGQQPDESILSQVKEIILSPGVPLDIPILSKARDKKIKIISEVELAYTYSETPIIAITGTNGKSTTTTLVGEIFKNSGKKTYVVGNIGEPIINHVEEASKKDIFILEISSFQLETVDTFKPKMGTIINITPDHLDRHKTIENYFDAKLKIVKNLRKEDIFLVNQDDQRILNATMQYNCSKIYFSLKQKVSKGAYYEDNIIKIVDNGNEYFVCKSDELKIPGIHNVQNVLVAIALSYFSGIEIKVIRDTLLSFGGVIHRLEYVRELDGIKFINDSKGTNTDASTTAIRAIEKPIILIAGGYDKNVSFDEWVDSFEGKVKYLIVIGSTADKIIDCAYKKGFNQVVKKNTFYEAVLQAYSVAKSGDTILLSPGCASWGMFENYEQRGNMFKEIVCNLGGK
ncbi:UDP-N-acetylmuramoyl-L-alanine--D-glutamate ligase [Alkalibaculum sporogenes]|nr:UDP-N-acetylmuramoyl-L-alanine--D-glutamate ligase [Alkalibaculum sporogenes]